MKEFDEFRKEREALEENSGRRLDVFRREPSGDIGYLTESENAEVDRWVEIFENEHGGELEEGFLGRLAGGAAGFIIGPSIGKVIARALGMKSGVMYDLLTSRLVSAALGAAIAKKYGGKYNG